MVAQHDEKSENSRECKLLSRFWNVTRHVRWLWPGGWKSKSASACRSFPNKYRII